MDRGTAHTYTDSHAYFHTDGHRQSNPDANSHSDTLHGASGSERTSATSVTLNSFTANWRSVSGATGYLLDVARDNAFINYIPGYQNLDVGNMTSFPVTGLSANTTYYYRVRAYNGCATSSNSNVKNVKTLPARLRLRARKAQPM